MAGVYCLGHDTELDLEFVAGELLRGQTLASVLSQRGKPPIALGLRLLGDAANGVAAGHRAGLVHRDLRPASLYLVRGDGERQVRVKVAGFGVPQIVRRESLAGAAPEVSAYASPEMLAAGSLRLTPASDVFSLGVVGYELLTGRPPLRRSRPPRPGRGRRRGGRAPRRRHRRRAAAGGGRGAAGAALQPRRALREQRRALGRAAAAGAAGDGARQDHAGLADLRSAGGARVRGGRGSPARRAVAGRRCIGRCTGRRGRRGPGVRRWEHPRRQRE